MILAKMTHLKKMTHFKTHELLFKLFYIWELESYFLFLQPPYLNQPFIKGKLDLHLSEICDILTCQSLHIILKILLHLLRVCGGVAKHLHTVSFMPPHHASFLTSPGTASFSELLLELSLWSYSSLIPPFRCQGELLGDTAGLQSVSLVLSVLNQYSGRVPAGTGKRGMPQEREGSF